MAYPETSNLGYVEPRDGDPADIQVINQYFTAKADEDIYLNRCMIAPFYSNEAGVVYNTGDIVQYERVVYKCLEDNVSGNWDATKWEQTTLGGEIATKGGGSASVTKEATGNPIELTDAASAPMVRCVTEIQGSQDLHGYDKPWVGGAGKNKSATSYATSTSTGRLTVNSGTFGECVANTEYTISFDVLETNGISVDLRFNNTTPKINTWDSGELIAGNRYSFTYTPATDGSFNFYTSSTGFSVETKVIDNVQVEVGSTATTYSPYSNICPITAYTEGEIEVRGKNLLNNADAEIGIAWNGGSNSARARLVVKKDPYTPYVISMNGANNMDAIYVKRYSSVPASDAGTQITSFPVTIPATDDNTFLIFAFSKTAISQTDVDNLKLQVEKGTTATTYEPYTSTTHTTTYPSAIYRGSEDVVNGEVGADADGEMWVTVDISTLDFSPSDVTRHIFRTDSLIGAIMPSSSPLSMPYAIASCYEGKAFTPLSADDNGYFGVAHTTHANEGRVVIIDHRFSTVADFVAGIAGQTIAYRLNTPTTSSVTPTNLPIKSLSGYNHIESTTGDMEVEYITDEYQPLVDLIQSSKHVYSTQEQVVGTWIDGSVLYEKTYYTTTVGATSNIDISDLNANRMWIVEGYWHMSQTDLPLNSSVYQGIYCHANVRATPPVLAFSNQMEMNIDAYAVVRYTKATATRSLSKSATIEDLSSETEKSLESSESVVKTNAEEVNEK